MAVAQLGVIAKDLGVKEFQVDLHFFVMAALPLALMLDRVMNGISRPLFGWISDNIGREKTMVIAFTLEGIGIIALGCFGTNPYAFLISRGSCSWPGAKSTRCSRLWPAMRSARSTSARSTVFSTPPRVSARCSSRSAT